VAAEPDTVGRDQRHQQAAERSVVLTVEFSRSSHRCRNPTGLWSVAQCTGLRVEDLPAFECCDIDFENLSLKVV
jgi:hypothetical protein